MIPQKLKPWLVMALIFVLGVGTGVSLTMALLPHFAHPPGAQQMKNRMLMGLSNRLNLTPDQQAKIQPILADAANQLQLLHRDEVQRMSQIMEKVNSQIAPILTPEQQEELKKMDRERERMFPGRMRGWDRDEEHDGHGQHRGMDNGRPLFPRPPDGQGNPPPGITPTPSPKS